MNKVKTHWEARWDSKREGQVQKFEGINAQADCKVFAMQQALENGKINSGDSYTRVKVFEVETHEHEDQSYTRDGVINLLAGKNS